jgi:hypothetical protein
VRSNTGRYSIQVIVAIQHENRDDAVAQLRRRLAEWMMEDIDGLGASPLAGSLLHYTVLSHRCIGETARGSCPIQGKIRGSDSAG